MLKELKIENLALIDKLDITLNSGLTVLTGETGAGKSIILSGISLVIGEKSSKELIGKNKEDVSLEAVFFLNDNQIKKIKEIGYDLEEELIIERNFDKDSNKNKINSKRSNLSALKEISSNVLDIVGQHDHQYLLNSNYHLSLLDKFIDNKDLIVKKELKNIIKELEDINEEISFLENEKKDLIEKKDLYNFTINEIFSQKLSIDEEENLEIEYKELFNAGMIKEKLSQSIYAIENSDLKMVKKNLEKLSYFSKEYEKIYQRFENIYDEIIDLNSEMIDKNNYLFEDSTRLDDINKKLDFIKKLKLKYGKNLKEILEYGYSLKEKLERLEFSDENLELKLNMKKSILKRYYEKTKILTNLRLKKATMLTERVKKELLELNMKNIEFKIDFKEVDRINENGVDSVKFLISTNKGTDLQDLSKIASGGEISRIMLALKIVFSKVDNISCLIFDEIDTGISGQTVIKIAKKLKELSENVQVICITHSPQIAAIADNHFKIYKEDNDEKTTSKIIKLDNDERVLELARILSGDNITNASLEIAKEMMLGSI